MLKRPTNMTTNLPSVPLAAAVLVLLLLQPCSSNTTAEEKMFQWVREAGGEINFESATVDGLRGTVAAKDIPEGGTLALVPQTVMFVAASDGKESLGVVAVRLMQEVGNSSSPRRLHWATVPTKQELLSEFTFPRSYFPLLQMPNELFLIQQQLDVERWWSKTKEPLVKQGFDLEDVKHAMGLLHTRSFKTQLGPHTLAPAIDLSNHETACPNHMYDTVCPGNKSMQCMHWVAGRDYKKGEAVCNTYGGMFNDKSLIQYGFVQDKPQPPHLYGVDRHDFVFDPYDMWVNQKFTKVLPEPFTSSNSSGYKQEAHRLRRILFMLQEWDKEPGSRERDEADPSGQILAMVLQWRELRKDALTAEISRIRGILESKGEKLQTEAQYMEQLAAQAKKEEEEFVGGDEVDGHADEL